MLLLLLAAHIAPASGAADRQSIYFDSGNGSDIRPEWTGILDAVAERLRQGSARVRLDSYTDRSGPDAANRRVAARRGQAVQAALVQRGVSTSAISTVAHGESDPLVPTPDGVREPQNRRVDLTVLP